eukprot:2800355-Amphidinium_carterae.1
MICSSGKSTRIVRAFFANLTLCNEEIRTLRVVVTVLRMLDILQTESHSQTINHFGTQWQSAHTSGDSGLESPKKCSPNTKY